MSGRRRLAFVAVVAGVALVGFLIARRARVAPQSSARTEAVSASAPGFSAEAPAAAGGVRAPLPSLPSLPSLAPPDEASPAALTPLGASRALEAISRNEQTRQLFVRLQRLGLSREQQDRVLLILGTQALHPAEESPTLVALRADGGSRVLSDEEANRVRDERRQIAERMLRPLRPALSAVLTPAQLAQAGLAAADAPTASKGDTRRSGERR